MLGSGRAGICSPLTKYFRNLICKVHQVGATGHGGRTATRKLDCLNVCHRGLLLCVKPTKVGKLPR